MECIIHPKQFTEVPYCVDRYKFMLEPAPTINELCEGDQQMELWKALFKEFVSLDDPYKFPSKKWFDNVKKIIESIGIDNYENQARKIFSTHLSRLAAVKNVKLFHENDIYLYSIEKNAPIKIWLKDICNSEITGSWFVGPLPWQVFKGVPIYLYSHFLEGKIVRGIILAEVIFNSPSLSDYLHNFSKVLPTYSHDVGFVYANQSDSQGIIKLVGLKQRAKNNLAIKRIDKFIAEVAKKRKLTPEQLVEESIPHYELDENGYIAKDYLDGTLYLALNSAKPPKIEYKDSAGKAQKSVPKSTEENDTEILKEFKALTKDLTLELVVVKNRIEEFYKKAYEIEFDRWKKFYFTSPLVSNVINGLLWIFTQTNCSFTGLSLNGEVIDAGGKKLDFNGEATKVKLWHPAVASAEEILAWKKLLDDKKLVQPFKQVYRETYRISDISTEEDNLNERFCGHILNKDKLAAIGKGRGWFVNDLSNGSGEYVITAKFPNVGINASLALEEVDLNERSKIYGSLHAVTQNIAFSLAAEEINAHRIDPVIYSETLRDIDLFISLTSIGNDVSWFESQLMQVKQYLAKYTTVDLSGVAKVRAEIIKRIILSLKKDNISIRDNFVFVKGGDRSFRIHLISGHVFSVEENTFYEIKSPLKKLAGSKTFVPVEADGIIEAIVSKAVFLSQQ